MEPDEARTYAHYLIRRERQRLDKRRRQLESKFGVTADYARLEAAEIRLQEFTEIVGCAV